MQSRVLETLLAIGALVLIGATIALALSEVEGRFLGDVGREPGWEEADDLIAGPSPAQAETPPVAWLTSDDYPAEAIRAGWQGTSAIRWTVDTHGRAVRCEVTSSSGHKILDDAACNAILARARYRPARNSAGHRVEMVLSRRVVWRLPD